MDFQKKSERLKSQPLYSLMENTTMCYGIVTKWLHSLLVFAKEGILLEFYHVRYCEPRKCRYIFVTFWGCLNHGGGQEKKPLYVQQIRKSQVKAPVALLICYVVLIG